MKKSVISILLTIVLIFSLCTPTFAVEPRADSISPAMHFSGDTVYCSITVSAIDKYIDVTLELWEEGTLMESWSESGTTYVGISQSYPAIPGWSYTLTITGTIGGRPMDADPIIGICPLTRSTP